MSPGELDEKTRNEYARRAALPGLIALNLFYITTPKDADDLVVTVLVPKLPREFKRLTLRWDEDDIAIAYTCQGETNIRVTPGINEAK